MLNDKNIAVLHDFLNPEQVFPKTNIRGGVCYFLWDESHNNEQSLTKVVTHQQNKELSSSLRSLKTENVDIFIRHNIAVQIVQKVTNSSDFKTMSEHISVLRPFGFRGYFVKDKMFREEKKGLKKPVICYGKGQKIGYVEFDEVKVRQNWINKYKVFTPRANNIGTELNDDNLNSFIGEPGTICTESYIVIGVDLELDKNTSIYLSKYLSTKFLRFMHSLVKASQDATSKTYKFVPLQDFTKKSDIDWNQSIEDLDSQLYKKYNLTSEEIEFIESMIKPM